MVLTVLFIVLLGAACLVPVVWAVVGIVCGNRRFWPTLLGLAWALVLMQVTIIGLSGRWGECASTSGIAENSVRCAVGDQLTSCAPDVWALECHRPVPGCGAIADGAFCPAGAAPVFTFCEHMQAGGVKQPWATWSDLAFVAAGLWLLWFLPFASRRTDGAADTAGEPPNPMREIGWLSVGYGLIVIFMGPPSMWYHASMKDWAGWFDSMSVVFWLMFNALYVLYMLAFAMWNRGRGRSRRVTVLAVWGGLAILSGIIAARFPHARIVLYLISGGLWGAAELACAIVAAASSKVVFRRTWWLFAINLGLLAVTMTLWMFFNDSIVSATSCQRRESFPGHAVFHILASISTVLTYISFASEKRTPTT